MSATKVYNKYFRLAGIAIEVRSDLPIRQDTFAPKFDAFAITAPQPEKVVIHHHFLTPKQDFNRDSAEKIYFHPPWAIYRRGDKWHYEWIDREPPYANYYQTVVTDREHTHLDIYNDAEKRRQYQRGRLDSLTMFPTDQIVLGRLLAYRKGCIVHSLGIIHEGDGYLFVGHSDAGKSTMAGLLKKEATILCDDRNIIREVDNQFMLSGTWSNGDVAEVSGETAPLKAIFFLRQGPENALTPVSGEMISFEKLLACLIRPLETRDWWDISLDFLARVSQEVPCLEAQFNTSGQFAELMKNNRVTA